MIRVALLLAVLVPGAAAAHPLAPSLLELRTTAPGEFAVRWKTPRLGPAPTRLEPVLPERCSPRSSPAVRAEGTARVTEWIVACGPAGLEGATLGVSGLQPRGAGAVIRIERGGDAVFQAVATAERPRVVVPARSTPLGVAWEYGKLGARHLLLGLDHVLLLLGLLALVQGARALLLTITAFTLGHSITLCAAALGLSPIPMAWAEVGIAATLVLLAAQLVPGQGRTHWIRDRPWRAAFAFGLLHGLGFAGALAEIGLPPAEVAVALLSFNLGIELGQLALVAVALVVAYGLLARPARVLPAPVRRVAVAYGVGVPAGFWLVERTARALSGS